MYYLEWMTVCDPLKITSTTNVFLSIADSLSTGFYSEIATYRHAVGLVWCAVCWLWDPWWKIPPQMVLMSQERRDSASLEWPASESTSHYLSWRRRTKPTWAADTAVSSSPPRSATTMFTFIIISGHFHSITDYLNFLSPLVQQTSF